jgi:DNA-binding NarL/FixJ family response regulator
LTVTSEADSSSGSRGLILLADDDEGVRGPIGRLLTTAGYEVTIVATGDAAAGALVTADYDLLITDINMPGNRELELLHSREETSGVPVIVITGYPTVPTAVQALRLAVIDYLIKPLDMEHLLDRVAKAVEKGRALRAVRKAQENVTTWTLWLQSMQTALNSPGTISLPAQPPNVAGPPEAREAHDADVLRRLPPEEFDSLSPREREVLREIASGRRVGDVAGTLHISPHTVRNHLKSIFRKLGVHSQVALLGKLTRQASPTRTPDPSDV